MTEEAMGKKFIEVLNIIGKVTEFKGEQLS